MTDRFVVLPRALHPGAWWLWALGLATAASRTTNLVLLAVIVCVAAYVVAARRGDDPWSGAFRAALVLGGVVIAVRLAFEVVFGADPGPTVLVDLPAAPLPSWAAGVVVGGPVTAEGLVTALREGSQIGAMIACVGAANALADPARLLKSVPGALYEVGVALVVALTLAPQALADVRRLRCARRLRGRPESGLRSWVSVALPALDGALARSLQLAASMDDRGYGRQAAVPARTRRASAGLVLGGLAGVVVGLYGLLDAGSPGLLGLPALVLGGALAAAGFWLAGQRSIRTRYRPDPWGAPEWATVGSAAVVGAAFVAARAANVPGVVPETSLGWPSVPGWLVAVALVGLVPAVAAPPRTHRPSATPVDVAPDARTRIEVTP